MLSEQDKELREKIIMVIIMTAGYAFLVAAVVNIYFLTGAYSDTTLYLTLVGLPAAAVGSGYFLRIYREKDMQNV